MTNQCSTPEGVVSSDGLGQVPERWYCVSADGMAMLCKDARDARLQAAESDTLYPRHAPHKAVCLGDVAAERERLRALIADDASAATYQSLGQYRTALLRALKA